MQQSGYQSGDYLNWGNQPQQGGQPQQGQLDPQSQFLYQLAQANPGNEQIGMMFLNSYLQSMQQPSQIEQQLQQFMDGGGETDGQGQGAGGFNPYVENVTQPTTSDEPLVAVDIGDQGSSSFTDNFYSDIGKTQTGSGLLGSGGKSYNPNFQLI